MKLWHSEPAMVGTISPALLACLLVLFSTMPLRAECPWKGMAKPFQQLCVGQWTCVWRGTAPACNGSCEVGETFIHDDGAGLGDMRVPP